MLAAEQKAEIVVFWALGDMDGPLSNEIKIGLNKRRSFQSDVIYRMRGYRSRALAHRVEVYIRGECAGLRLKTAVAQRLHELGCGLEKPDWFRAGIIVSGIVIECAAIERITLMTDEQAREAEQVELFKIMDQVAG